MQDGVDAKKAKKAAGCLGSIGVIVVGIVRVKKLLTRPNLRLLNFNKTLVDLALVPGIMHLSTEVETNMTYQETTGSRGWVVTHHHESYGFVLVCSLVTCILLAII